MKSLVHSPRPPHIIRDTLAEVLSHEAASEYDTDVMSVPAGPENAARVNSCGARMKLACQTQG